MFKVNIGSVEICGRVVLAPMAGVTDIAYRELCASFGASLTVTEMVSAQALHFKDKKTNLIAKLGCHTGPASIQIFGSDPELMAGGAKSLMQFKPDIIDVNMGCPVPKVAGNRSGSALMKEPERCGKIVAAMVSDVPVPITVKIRKGWDENLVNAVEVAKICEKAGASAIAVHGRTRKEMYTGVADWDIIRQVKQAVSIPVIGNGDIVDAITAAQMLEQTGCDLVMVGRGALGNPWVFRQINFYLQENCQVLTPPSIAERVVVIKKHVDALCTLKGEERGMKEARKHVAWYLHGLKGAAGLRKLSGQLVDLSDLDTLLKKMYICNQKISETT